MMTQEEKFSLVDNILAARKRGDFEEANRLKTLVPLSESMAKCALLHYGAEGLEKAKSMGLNFSEMEEKYGQEWFRHV